MRNKYLLITILLFGFSFLANAQTIIQGTITDATNEPLIGVTVQIGSSNGAVTDYDGNYQISVNKGTHQISFSYIGYDKVTKKVVIDGTEGVITLRILMKPSATILDAVVVSGSHFEKNITEETVSIDIIPTNLIENNSFANLSEAIERMPGVQVMDGQVNIRSGSGYAYGAGSRVMVMVDEQPLLSAELSDVKWNFIPIENAQQIEIIKGASSVLYGSGGLNGVINVRTAYPTDKPRTSISLYKGLYNAPKDKSRQFWTGLGEIPNQSGIYFSHRQKIKKNFDLVLGANIHSLKSFLKGADEHRIRLNFNTRWRPPNNDRMSLGVNGNVMYHEVGNFFIWKDGFENAYVHINDPFGRDAYSTISLDPYLTVFDKSNNKHSVKARFFNIVKQQTSQKSPTSVVSLEYQLQRNFEERNLTLTSGMIGQYAHARSVLFARLDTLGNFSTQSANIGAVYLQADKKIGNLNLTGGVRWEAFRLGDSENASIPVFRAGANYKIKETNFLRTSFGQGYRVPSLGERYITANVTDDIKILPNPGLKPESGWNAEIGYKKAIKTKTGWNGYLDAAFFWMEYDDMTEFYFDFHRPDSLEGVPTIDDLFENLGFRAVNVSKARIAGIDITAFMDGRIGQYPIRFFGGYTYTFPGDLESDTTQRKVGTYLKNFAKGFILSDKESDLIPSILKYRSLHTTRLDVEMDFKDFTFGAAANFNSFIYNIDEIFVGEGDWGRFLEDFTGGPLIPGIKEFREKNNNGDWIFDLRAAYKINDENRVNFVVSNMLNREYTLRPAKMNPPRSFNIKYQLTF